MSSSAVPWQRLPTVEILQLNALRFYRHSLPCRTQLFDRQLTTNWVWDLCYDRRSVGQSVLQWSTHLELTIKFLSLSDSCGFVDVERSLWREDWSVVYNCCWFSSLAQSFSGPRPVGLANIFYFSDSRPSFSSLPTTRRATLEVSNPASTRVS
jgi:hypothetical protein